jgi:hypothetical protein
VRYNITQAIQEIKMMGSATLEQFQKSLISGQLQIQLLGDAENFFS